jgi:hypothetical protein
LQRAECLSSLLGPSAARQNAAMKRAWFRLTPNRIVAALLIAECGLWLAEVCQWFSSAWAALVAIAIVGVAAIVMFGWFAGSLIFRWRFQFSLLALLVLVVAVAIPCGWFAVEFDLARRQSEAVKELMKLQGTVWYDCQFNSDGTAVMSTQQSRPEWLASLFGDDFFSTADAVSLRGDQVTNAALDNLRGLPRLRVLDLFDTRVTEAGLVHLTGLPRLEKLYLDNINVSDATLAHFARLTRLRVLNLDGTRITDAGLEQIAALENLQVLWLNDTNITDAGLPSLTRLTKLQHLGLINTKVTDASLDQLKRLAQLQAVWLIGTRVTEDGVKKFRKAMPNCRSVH